MITITCVTTGANSYVIGDYVELAYTQKGNDVGSAVVTVRGNHAALAGLALDDPVAMWMSNDDPTWAYTARVDWRGFYRGAYRRWLEDGQEVVDLFFWHEMELLQRAINAYKAGVAGYSVWSATATDQIMTDLVNNNFSGAAGSRITTATSKVVSGSIITPFGSTVDFAAAYRNVLAALQDLATIDGSVFTVAPTFGGWSFQVYPLTIGTDRRAYVLFDVRSENMVTAELDDQKVRSTVAIVAGQGEEAARTVVTVTSADRAIGTNNLETYLDARHLTTSGALTAYGNAHLEDNRNRQIVRFQPLQKVALAYGKHYYHGDVVAVRFGGTTKVQRIQETTVQVRGGETLIQLGTEDI